MGATLGDNASLSLSRCEIRHLHTREGATCMEIDFSYADANEIRAIALAKKALQRVRVPEIYFARKKRSFINSHFKPTEKLQTRSYVVQTTSLGLRQAWFNPENKPPIPTIAIAATRHVVDERWLDAAREIHSLLRQENFPQVCVEIMDPRARKPPTISPVSVQNPIFNQWHSVLGAILNSIDLTDINQVDCFRRGRNEQSTTDNPVTVLILVNSSSNKQCWKSTRDTIVGILDHFGLPMVAVDIMKDQIGLL
ncbi:hypothetical protein N7492_004910 [Penicillium capsulatum]|uniref:Uncharacterized protein n=1 Tax=Penicillium capsulatum TaxID=69766 RepID=A0A9W9LQN1_9EURO|nr:hypothetical protein N7492_004910 [Penicillium capsulatum]KAJ6135982.1 hypothetical protein N7512_001142 [Penicillium capsulatum]